MTSSGHFLAHGSQTEAVKVGGSMGATGDAKQPWEPGGAEWGSRKLGDASTAGQVVLTNPWNITIKPRQVQQRGCRLQMTTSFT